MIHPGVTQAQSRGFRLGAPAALVDSGLLKFIVPRFSLKTATRIKLVGEGEAAEARLNHQGQGRLVFAGPQGNWHLQIDEGDDATRRFENWLTGAVGQNTIAAFTVDGQQPYRPAAEAKAEVKKVTTGEDAKKGEALAERLCGRCHMVNENTRFTTIGSTPSFALMRGFADWYNRFEAFYAYRPHPSFTMVEGVTPPFDKTLPPPIEPLRITPDEIQAILAYVITVKPADLGSALKLQ